MKLALIIAGYLRGLTENIENIKKNIIRQNECDIYIHITADDSDSKYSNNKISLEFIQKELKPKILLTSNNLNFTQDKTLNNLLNQNYKYYWLNEERKKINAIENSTYDVIVKLRPDVHVIETLNFYDLAADKIYIPLDSKIDMKKLARADDKYICDIIAYGAPTVMNEYLDYYNHITRLVKLYGRANETLLAHYLIEKNIPYELVDVNFMVILSICNTIAITGDSGSGKTTVSTILKDLFQDSFLLECDRYHKWERNSEQWTTYTHLNPAANYLTKMQQDVFDLKIGNTIYQVDYDHTTGKFTDKISIEPAENIIVCGLHSLYLSETTIDIKIYMDTDENLRIPWKIKRDIEKRGYSIEKIMEQIKLREEDFIKYIYPQKKTADIIIHLYTNKPFMVDDFSLTETIDMYFKIGVKNKYSINPIIQKLNSQQIKFKRIATEEDEIYIYFENLCDYKDVIKLFVLNVKKTI
jgi:uridine kinase